MSQTRITVLPNTTVTTGGVRSHSRRSPSRSSCSTRRASDAPSTRSAAVSSRPSLMGLPVPRTKIAVYVVSGFCASLGGTAVHVRLGAVGQPAARDRHGARRHRRRRHRRYVAHRWVRLRHRIAPRRPRLGTISSIVRFSGNPQLRLDAHLQRFARARVHRDAARDHARPYGADRRAVSTTTPCRDHPACTTSPVWRGCRTRRSRGCSTTTRTCARPPRSGCGEAIVELGYRRNAAARSLVTRRSGVIGLLTPARSCTARPARWLPSRSPRARPATSSAWPASRRRRLTALGAAVEHFKDQAAEAVV